MPEPVSLKYRAFLSYSHTDAGWARWLHATLEGFRIDKDLVGRGTATGRIPRTLRPVFRDREDFTAGHILNLQTVAALDVSAALVVLCSPISAKSRYVNEEIRLFKSRHPDRPVIPVIVAGVPNDPKEECLAPALKFKLNKKGKITSVPEELLAADVHGDGRSLSVAKVVARLLGLQTDDVFRRAERERLRQLRKLIAFGLVIATLTSLGGFLAWQSHQRQQTIAEVEAIVAKYTFENVSDAVPSAEESLTNAIVAIVEGAASDARYVKALELLKEGKPKQAEPLLKAVAEEKEVRAAREGKQAGAAYENLGAIIRLSEPKRAREAYAKAVALGADSFDALYWNARLQFEAGNLDASEQTYKRVLSLKRDEEGLCETCWASCGLGDIAHKRGQVHEALRYYRDCLAQAHEFAKSSPNNLESQIALGAAYDRMGDALQALGKSSEGLQYYRESLAIVIHLATVDVGSPRSQRNLWVSQAKLGNHLALIGNLEEALRTLQDALALADRLTKHEPRNEEWQRELGVSYELIAKVLALQHNFDQALRYVQDSLDIKKRLAQADPDNVEHIESVLDSYLVLGDVLLGQANLTKSLKAYRDCLAIANRLAKDDPDSPIGQRRLSTSLIKIGDVLLVQDNHTEALQAYQKALGILEKLAGDEPSSTDRQRDVMQVYIKLGDAQLKGDLRAEALTSYQASLTIARHLAETDTANSRWKGDVALSLNSIGKLKLGSGDHAGALTAYEQMLSIARHMIEFNTSNIEWQQAMAASLEGVGDAKLRSRDSAGALAAYEESLAIRRQLVEIDKSNTQSKYDLAWTLKRLADARLSCGDGVGALTDYNRAIELGLQDAYLYSARGQLYSEMRELDKALADFDKALSLNKDHALALSSRAWVLGVKQNQTRPIGDYREAIQLAPPAQSAEMTGCSRSSPLTRSP
jgi:tetratricopeptide (TPR) repeat protein